MDWTGVLIGLGLGLMLAVAAYFWGRKSQETASSAAYDRQIKDLERKEKKAIERIQAKLNELDSLRTEFDTLPWEERLRLLGLDK